MRPDSQGFVYPEVDEAKCVECGLCLRVCPFINIPARDDEFSQRIYGCRLRDNAQLALSQSGGVFYALAREAVELGYAVYGVELDSRLVVRHSRADNQETLQAFRGSKYVQSLLEGVFQDVVARLRRSEKIFFIGTGCQVAGLVSLCRTLRVDTQSLLTADLICHGVPSPRYWHDYLQWMERKYGAKVVRADFRDKSCGWANTQNSLTLSDGRKVYPEERFYSDLLLRRSCYECPFTGFERCSDLTLGDYWGVEKVRPELAADNRGVSLVMVNSPKGEEWFERIRPEMECFVTDREHCLQPQLQHPVPLPAAKDRWEAAYDRLGFSRAAQKLRVYRRPSRLRRLLRRLKRRPES